MEIIGKAETGRIVKGKHRRVRPKSGKAVQEKSGRRETEKRL